ncbi:MAG: hypothetical protein FJ206_09185 [Gemmatimonadetes bacterium]|nr:hypothetical protein [Gemmatimonadota bacterium]
MIRRLRQRHLLLVTVLMVGGTIAIVAQGGFAGPPVDRSTDLPSGLGHPPFTGAAAAIAQTRQLDSASGPDLLVYHVEQEDSLALPPRAVFLGPFRRHPAQVARLVEGLRTGVVLVWSGPLGRVVAVARLGPEGDAK